MNHVIEMSIDPSEYDLGELAESNGNGFVFPEDDGYPGSSDETLRAGHYRELLMLQSASAGEAFEKPYLDSPPRSKAAEETAFEWLEFLVEKGGFKRAYDAIHHYRTLGWLTESVEQHLRDYLAGIPESNVAETRPFDQSDHLLSLIYIGRLASR